MKLWLECTEQLDHEIMAQSQRGESKVKTKDKILKIRKKKEKKIKKHFDIL